MHNNNTRSRKHLLATAVSIACTVVFAVCLTLAIEGTLAAASQAAVPPSCGYAQPIHVINEVPIRHPSAQVRAVENAVEIQSAQLAAAWHVPCVRFANHGWPLILRARGGPHFLGYHDYSYRYNTPYMIVGVQTEWTITFSHEVLETDVDPNANGRHEVCDPVENFTYNINGIAVSDFVWPQFFRRHSHGRFDEMGYLKRTAHRVSNAG